MEGEGRGKILDQWHKLGWGGGGGAGRSFGYRHFLGGVHFSSALVG